MKTIFLVDGDNNIGTGLTGVDMLSDQDTVLIFYQKEKGLALSKLQKLCAGTAADVQYIESVRGGKNSIDFQIITELGVLVGKREADYAYVISQDKGYAASIDALQARYANAFQEVALRPSIESCLHLPFILRASDRQELANALVKEYGSAQGCALYNHLKRLFQAGEPEMEKAVKVSGTGEIDRVEVISMGHTVCRHMGAGTELSFTFTDSGVPEHGWQYYYVRVHQKDKAMAWSSPIWVS